MGKSATDLDPLVGDLCGLETRIGDKKAEAVTLTFEQAQQLKDQPDTAQGRRDALIMCVLLDHGLCRPVVAAIVS